MYCDLVDKGIIYAKEARPRLGFPEDYPEGNGS
jgi:hypothetical protein